MIMPDRDRMGEDVGMRPAIDERIAGNTNSYVPHPGTDMNAQSAEAQEYLRSIGMDGASDPMSSVTQTVVASEIQPISTTGEPFGSVLDISAADVRGLSAGEYTL